MLSLSFHFMYYQLFIVMVKKTKFDILILILNVKLGFVLPQKLIKFLLDLWFL
jgi:hypothetical protein